MLRTIVVDLAADERLAKDLVATGGVFASGAKLKLDDTCNLILRAGQEELQVVARTVLVTDAGSGLEVVGRTSELREQIAAFARIASYLASTKDPRVAAARASRQDTIPAMPPKHDAPAATRGKGEIVERVRRIRYDTEDGEPEASRTKTLTRTLAESGDAQRRRPAGSVPPGVVHDASGSRRLATGSLPPDTAAPPAPPADRPVPGVPLALAPTQRAESLESKALAAQIAAQVEADEDER